MHPPPGARVQAVLRVMEAVEHQPGWEALASDVLLRLSGDWQPQGPALLTAIATRAIAFGRSGLLCASLALRLPSEAKGKREQAALLLAGSLAPQLRLDAFKLLLAGQGISSSKQEAQRLAFKLLLTPAGPEGADGTLSAQQWGEAVQATVDLALPDSCSDILQLLARGSAAGRVSDMQLLQLAEKWMPADRAAAGQVLLRLLPPADGAEAARGWEAPNGPCATAVLRLVQGLRADGFGEARAGMAHVLRCAFQCNKQGAWWSPGISTEALMKLAYEEGIYDVALEVGEAADEQSAGCSSSRAAIGYLWCGAMGNSATASYEFQE